MRVSFLLTVLGMAEFVASSATADEPLSESEAIAKIQQLGGKILDGRPRTAAVQLNPVPTLVIPFWSIVVPLTLISAYLLLSRPRSVNLKAAKQADWLPDATTYVGQTSSLSFLQ